MKLRTWGDPFENFFLRSEVTDPSGAKISLDRWFFIQLYRWFPSVLKVLRIVRPETLLRWRRAGFHRYWRWKSRRRGGRPRIETELRTRIRRMSIENPFGVRRGSTANYSSSGLRSRSRMSLNT